MAGRPANHRRGSRNRLPVLRVELGIVDDALRKCVMGARHNEFLESASASLPIVQDRVALASGHELRQLLLVGRRVRGVVDNTSEHPGDHQHSGSTWILGRRVLVRLRGAVRKVNRRPTCAPSRRMPSREAVAAYSDSGLRHGAMQQQALVHLRTSAPRPRVRRARVRRRRWGAPQPPALCGLVALPHGGVPVALRDDHLQNLEVAGCDLLLLIPTRS
mmetsp:Transcript_14638/g.40101  ORF Transcript_14638/g.40101 Transcript_14638/m.40101 type:complete len:218 (-) Transcript_14638:192-845(-)